MEIVTENAVTLAWLGDALMNTYIREHLLKKGIPGWMPAEKKHTIPVGKGAEQDAAPAGRRRLLPGG